MLIIIPATAGHLATVEISVMRMKTQYPSARFLIVCPLFADFSHLKGDDVEIIEDEKFMPLTKQDLEKILSPEKKQCVSWYYQQILKYAVIARSFESRLLLIDADTILIRNVNCEKNVFFTERGRHDAYFSHFYMLFDETAKLNNSAITNFMWFEPKALREMLSEINMRHGKEWWKVIVDKANDIPVNGAFSEYETYANWISLRQGTHLEVPIHLFRRGDLLVNSKADYTRLIKEIESHGYDGVAFELHHRNGFFLKIGAWFALKLGLKLW